MKQFTLPKTERLYLRESISELFANGSSFTAFPYRVVYLLKEENDESRPAEEKQSRCAIMTVAPKKRFKHAVDRNHVKRLTREAYRKQKLPLWDALCENKKAIEVAFLYIDNKFISYEDTYNVIGKAISKLIKKVSTSDKILNTD